MKGRDNVNFKKATLQQLAQILRHEECEIGYKLAAEYEMERRAKQNEFSLAYFVPHAKRIG